MRNELSELLFENITVEGKVAKYGKRLHNGSKKLTIMIEDVRSGNQKLSDHLWVSDTDNFKGKGLKWGESHVRFNGVVDKYLRKNGTVDFCINEIQDVKVL